MARCLVGIAPSSASVEVYNGVAGHFVPRQKSSGSTQILEMKIFIKRNKEFIDWDSIEEIPVDELKVFYPASPAIPFVDNELEKDESTFQCMIY